MKKTLLLTVFTLVLTSLLAQAPVVIWDKWYGGNNDDEAFYAAPSPDGGFIVCGYTMSQGQGKKDIWVMKLSESGDKVWENTYGGPGDDIAYHFCFGKNNEIILAGTTDSWGRGKLDFLILAIDQNGRQLWRQTYGAAGDDVLKRIIPLTDSTWLSFGETDSWGAGRTDIFMMQTDTGNRIIRRKTLGGRRHERFGDVVMMEDSTYAIIGSSRSFSHGAFDAWLNRVDEYGRNRGRKYFGYARFEHGYGILPTPDGGYIIAGATNTKSAGYFDGWAIKINRDLFQEWEVKVGDRRDENFITAVAHKNIYVMAGNTQSYGNGGWDLWKVGVNTRGEVLWSETFGYEGHDYINSFIQLDDGTYLATGYTTSHGNGNKDFWIVKLE